MGKAPFHVSADMKARAAAKANDPQVIERREMVARIASRGPLSFAIIEHALPADVAVIVRLGQPGPVARYAVASADGLDDTVVWAALAAAFGYESRHDGDMSPVSIVVHKNGLAIAHSAALGESTFRVQPGRVADTQRHSGRLLANRPRGQAVHVDGVGAAVIVPFPDARGDK